MRDYRCYHIDAAGHILGVEAFEVPGDAEACDRARLIVMNLQWRAHELWQLSRKVTCPTCVDEATWEPIARPSKASRSGKVS